MTSRFPLQHSVRQRRNAKILGRSVRLVSFDVFGTALLRQVVDPEDKHSLVAHRLGLVDLGQVEQYRRDRRSAEQAARKKAAAAGRTEVGIAEIRTELEQVLTAELWAKRPIQLELKVEQELATPNREILEFHRFARSKSMKIAFTAETCLPHGLVSKMLRSAGFDWDHLLLSSQTGRTKQDGGLFKSILERTGLSPRQVLHVGNDRETDLELAELANLRTNAAKKRPPLVSEAEEQFVEHRTGVDSVALAIAAEHRARVADKVTCADVGYYTLGPMVTGFIDWARQQLLDELPDHILIAPRLRMTYDLLANSSTQIEKRIRTTSSLWPNTTTVTTKAVEQFVDDQGITVGDRIVILDLGWDDRAVASLVDNISPDLRVSISGICLGLLEAPATSTIGWAFGPAKNRALADRISKSDFLRLLGSAETAEALGQRQIKQRLDEVTLGMLAFAEDIEPWLGQGPTTASLCLPALQTIEHPTFAEAQRITDGWIGRSRLLSEKTTSHLDAGPFRNRLVRSLQQRPETKNGVRLHEIWRQGSRALEQGGSFSRSTQQANRRLARRSLRLGQRPDGDDVISY